MKIFYGKLKIKNHFFDYIIYIEHESENININSIDINDILCCFQYEFFKLL